MPPKPKGLKASSLKRPAAFDPSAAAPSPDVPIPSTSAAPALNKEGTAPLDDDALTLFDLFELRTNVSEVLYPFPHSLAVECDPDRADEARSLLRGILHGCAVLEPFVVQTRGEEDEGEEGEGERTEQKVEKRRKDLGEGKVKALGLDEILCEGWIVALQLFALHHLAELFEEPESVAVSAVAKSVGSSSSSNKRRKVDVREPKTRLEWLEAAYDRARLLWDVIIADYGDTLDDRHDNMQRASAFLQGEYSRTATAYARELLLQNTDAAAQTAAQVVQHKLAWATTDWIVDEGWGLEAEIAGGLEECAEGILDADDAFLAQIRAWSAWVALLEAHPGAFGSDGAAAAAAAVSELNTVAKGLDAFKKQWLAEGCASETDDKLVEAGHKDKVPQWRFLLDVVAADARGAKFILVEEAVEEKYRPEEEEGEDEEDDEGEGEVKPLPEGAEEVVEAKKAGEEAISAVRATLAAHDALPKEVRHPEGKRGQWRKLEELLLVSSALINPSDTEGTARVEKEIEEVRKEGGLEDDGNDEGEGEGN
ncbi:hypothetical protein JCM6882_003896 [Rhodosporidiobolus microsporus]